MYHAGRGFPQLTGAGRCWWVEGSLPSPFTISLFTCVVMKLKALSEVQSLSNQRLTDQLTHTGGESCNDSAGNSQPVGP